MHFYEVFVRLLKGEKEMGRTAVQLQADTPFMAAVKAADELEGRYGNDIVSSTIRVDQITQEEFLYQMAA